VIQHAVSAGSLTSALATCDALLSARVPPAWQHLAFDAPVSLQPWLHDFQRRHAQAAAWAAAPPWAAGTPAGLAPELRLGEAPPLERSVCWSALCRPRALLGAVLLFGGARGRGWLNAAREAPVLECTVARADGPASLDAAAVRVDGLRLARAAWDEGAGLVHRPHPRWPKRNGSSAGADSVASGSALSPPSAAWALTGVCVPPADRARGGRRASPGLYPRTCLGIRNGSSGGRASGSRLSRAAPPRPPRAAAQAQARPAWRGPMRPPLWAMQRPLGRKLSAQL